MHTFFFSQNSTLHSMAKIHSPNLALNIHKHYSCDASQLDGRPTWCKLFWAACGQICTADAHKLLFPSFRSKFWQCHSVTTIS